MLIKIYIWRTKSGSKSNILSSGFSQNPQEWALAIFPLEPTWNFGSRYTGIVKNIHESCQEKK